MNNTQKSMGGSTYNQHNVVTPGPLDEIKEDERASLPQLKIKSKSRGENTHRRVKTQAKPPTIVPKLNLNSDALKENSREASNESTRER